MNEKSNKRREWVKNAAIVFLSVLLVLTFFSNTIMNYSLPEVATQYVESGTITAKIRGTGIVESSDPYSVKLKTTNQTNATGVYEVDSVEVKTGDTVLKGDVLCHLASGDSKLLEDAQDALNSQILAYEIQILQGSVSNSVLDHAQSGATASMSTYQNRVLAKENQIQALKDELKEAEDTLKSWQTQSGHRVDTSEEKTKLDAAQAAYKEVKDVVDDALFKISQLQNEINDTWDVIIQNYEFEQQTGGMSTVSSGDYEEAKHQKELLQNQINKKRADIAADEANLPGLKKALDEAQNNYDNKASNTDDNIQKEISNWMDEVEKRRQKVADAEEEKTQMISDIVTELQWGDTLAELKENIAKLQEENVGGEVTAPISGTIISVNVKSGKDTPGDGILFEIQPEGRGYTMQFSVTNEQAKRLSVGDVAELVNSWRYDDVDVVLSSIRPDPSDPGQSKQLTFDVSGSVTAGQSLNVSVGQRSATYDLIVPNSAVREDNNGKFILIVETKSTPLSNRYIATRVDVEVIASDDTRSAVKGALNGWEYVITTSTAPVEAGKQVRLADN